MKTNPLIFTLFLGLAVGLPAFSQTTTTPIAIPLEKGSHFVGVSATGDYSGGENGANGLQITAQGGIFAAKQLVTGVQLGYNRHYESNAQPGLVGTINEFDAERTVNGFSPELFARYYPFQSRFRPILQVSAGGLFQSRDRTSFSDVKSNDKSSAFTAAAGLGLGWFVAKRVSVELLYQIRTQPPVVTRRSSELRLGVSIFLK